MTDPGELPAPPNAMQPLRRAPTVLLREGALWVFDKPAGLATHPGHPRVPDLITYARRHLDAPEGLSPVHRLDKDTSGVLLAASDPELRGQLGTWFAEGQVTKRYLALLIGPLHKKGVIRKTLADERRGRPLPAVTRYRCLRRLGGFSLVSARPETGRKHQLRKHFQAMGRPIVGDKLYPGRRRVAVPAFPGRLWLHAESVALPDGRRFASPLPPELEAHLEALTRGREPQPASPDAARDTTNTGAPTR